MSGFTSRRARAVMLALTLFGVGRDTVLPHECATMATHHVAEAQHEVIAQATGLEASHVSEHAPDHASHHASDHAASHGANLGSTHGASHAQVPSDSPADSPSSHDCDCVGQGCCVPIATLALASAAGPAPLSLTRIDALPRPTQPRLATATRYLRPFANGPPAVTLA